MLIFYSVIIFVILISDFFLYFLILSKVHKLLILDKRQQSYINDLMQFDAKLAIKQKLFFCISLTLNENTKEIGLKQLKQHFNLNKNILNNKKKLAQYFIEINNAKNLTFKLQNSKYTIIK